MKTRKLITGLVMLSSCCLQGSGFITHAESLTHTVTLDPSGISISETESEDGQLYSHFVWDGLASVSESGLPDIPTLYFRFLVPTLSTDFSVTLEDANAAGVWNLERRLSPAVEMRYTDNGYAEMLSVPSEEAYSGFSGLDVIVEDEQVLEGRFHMVGVRVRPVTYDDSNLTLTAYDSMTVRLDYRTCGASEMSVNVNPSRRSSLKYPLETLVVNPGDFSNTYSARAAAATGKYYIIVAPQNLCESLAPLVTWKSQKGYIVTLKDIESIISDSRYKPNGNSGREDNATALRNWLKDQYNASDGDVYCLLVGDYRTSMPIRYAYLGIKDKVSKLLNTGNYIPSDAYFANVSQDWNLSWDSNNSVYVTAASRCLLPDIILGRLICNNKKHIEEYLKKLFLYESNPGRGDTDYLDNVFAFEQNSKEFGSLIGYSDKMMNIFKNNFTTTLYQDKCLDSTPTAWPEGKHVIEAMRNAGISGWFGHGLPTNIAVSGNKSKNWLLVTAREEYTDADLTGNKDEISLKKAVGDGLNTLRNKDKPSIVFSISCSNAPFDEYHEGLRKFTQPYNLASSFTVAGEYGGPAFLGNSREFPFSDVKNYSQYFANGLLQNPKVGITENYLKTSHNTNMAFHMHYLCGDPEFEIWLGKPNVFNLKRVYSPTSVLISSSMLANSTILIYDGSGNCTETVCNSTSQAVSSSSPIMAFGVWKRGFLPEIDLFTRKGSLTSAEKKFVVRNAGLGTEAGAETSLFTVGNGGKLNVRAIDEIKAYSNFEVAAGGNVSLECDMTTELNGCKVKEGATLSASGKTVVIQSDFCVEEGGSIEIQW